MVLALHRLSGHITKTACGSFGHLRRRDSGTPSVRQAALATTPA